MYDLMTGDMGARKVRSVAVAVVAVAVGAVAVVEVVDAMLSHTNLSFKIDATTTPGCHSRDWRTC